MKLSQKLVSRCEDEAKVAELKAIIANSHVLTTMLREIVEEKIELTRKERESKKAYMSPSWQYQQADYNGEIRGMHLLLDIIPNM